MIGKFEEDTMGKKILSNAALNIEGDNGIGSNSTSAETQLSYYL